MRHIFAFALGIGLVAGLRALTPPALVAWAAYLGWLNLDHTALAFMGSITSVIIFSSLALFELIGDLMPRTPKRTAPFPLVVRILTGAFCGACIQYPKTGGWILGAIIGAIGAVIGAFAGYESRRRLVSVLNVKDVFIALPEDLIAIGLGIFFVSR